MNGEFIGLAVGGRVRLMTTDGKFLPAREPLGQTRQSAGPLAFLSSTLRAALQEEIAALQAEADRDFGKTEKERQ